MLNAKTLIVAAAMTALGAPAMAQAQSFSLAHDFQVVDYDYVGDCEPSFVAPSIGADGNTLEVPFEGSGFDAFADDFEGIRADKAECVVFVTVRIPWGVRVSPHYIDIVGEADLDEGARGRISAQYRFLEGSQSPVAAERIEGEFVGGVRVQSPRTFDAGWSKCGDTKVTFRVSSAARIRLRGDAEFGEINMTNGVGTQAIAGFRWGWCW